MTTTIIIGVFIALYIALRVAAAVVESRRDAEVQWLFKTKVVGVSHRNSDHQSRQKIIKEECTVGDRVKLIPEPNNKHDPNAIGVWTDSGRQIGYLDSTVARIAAEHGEADELVAKIIRVHGGEDGQYLGVALEVGKKKPQASPEVVAAKTR